MTLKRFRWAQVLKQVVGPAAAALAAPIAELISATSVAAAAIKCGCVSKLGLGYSSTTACLHRATAEPAPVS
ncbi:MAG: hypothetical protein ACLQLO_04060 [Mycobacterium sp.]